MGASVVSKFINLEAGLYFETSFSGPNKLEHALGKNVEIESVEMDCYEIDGVYYKTVGTWEGLIQIAEMEPQKPSIQEEWDLIHKKLWDTFEGYLNPEQINNLADKAMEELYGVGVMDEEDNGDYAKVLTFNLYFEPGSVDGTEEDDIVQDIIRGVDKTGFCVGDHSWETRRV